MQDNDFVKIRILSNFLPEIFKYGNAVLIFRILSPKVLLEQFCG